MNKKVLWAFVLLLLFIITVNLATRQYVEEIKSVPADIPQGLKDVPKIEEVPLPGEVVAGAREGIIIVNKFNKPQTQDEWDRYMRGLIVDNKVLDSDEGSLAMQKMSINKRQYAETLERLAEETRKVEQIQAQNPGDPAVQERMDNLRKAKALTKVLVERGVVSDGAADLPGMTTPKDMLIPVR